MKAAGQVPQTPAPVNSGARPAVPVREDNPGQKQDRILPLFAFFAANIRLSSPQNYNSLCRTAYENSASGFTLVLLRDRRFRPGFFDAARRAVADDEDTPRLE